MSLISMEFLLFVIAAVTGYYLIPRRFQWVWLLAFSYIYYVSGGIRVTCFLLFTTVTTYFAGRWMEQTAQSMQDKKEEKKRKKQILAGTLILNFGVLGVLKYTNFMLDTISSITGGEFEPLTLLLPLGISFYTFQSMGYLLDVYWGRSQAEHNLFRFALFVSFFPQILQGPIGRFGSLGRQLYASHSLDRKNIEGGFLRILWGYFKKMVIADRILVGVTAIIKDAGTYEGAYVLVGMLFYTLELYADFTGGIDITIGIAQTMGITVQENFNRPYFSKSLKEYWRRWHISMCSWFRDYIFYPFSISKPMQRFTKFSKRRFGDRVGRRLPMYLSSFMVWLATGVWHGASWNFIVWGLGNWAVLMVSEEFEPLYEKFHKRFGAEGKLYAVFQMLRTFMLVCCLNLFDCYASLGDTFRAFASLFTAGNWQVLWDGSLMNLGLSLLDYGILAAGTVLMLVVSLLQRSGSVRAKIGQKPYPLRFAVWYGLFLIVLLMGAYGIGYDASQFIYNQF